MNNDLLSNLDKLHTTELGALRIKRNLGLDCDDVVSWCKNKIRNASQITAKGKNWYITIDGIILTVNGRSFTIITAHPEKGTPLSVSPKNHSKDQYADDYQRQIDRLRRLLGSPKTFDQALTLALDVHAATHTCMVSGGGTPTLCDHLLAGLAETDYSIMPTKKDETIAWHLWHIARIEDLVGNLLIAGQPQVFNRQWMAKLAVDITDTGNAMTDKEIIDFSRKVNKAELINYRNAAGIQTRKILTALSPDDLKRRPQAKDLERLVSEGGLLECKKSIWLKDFWGGRTVVGLILLPLTRHHMMHLPDSIAIKKAIKEFS